MNIISRILLFIQKQKVRTMVRKVGILFGIILLIYQIVNGYQVLLSVLIGPSFFQVLFALLVMFIGIFFQILEWWYIMVGLNVPISLKSAIKGYMLSFLPRYIPGSIWGYLSRNEWLLQDLKVQHSVTNLGSILEIFIGVMSSILVIGIYGYWDQMSYGKLKVFLLVVILIFISYKACKHFFQLAIVERRVGTVGQLFLSSFSLSRWFLVFLLKTVNLLFFGFALLIITNLVTERITISPIISQVLSYSFFSSFAWIVGFIIIFVPSGLGVREFILAGLLTNYVYVTAFQAGAVVILYRISSAMSELLWVLPNLLFNWSNGIIKSKSQ